MEKIVNAIGVLKWLSPLLGLIMYMGTVESFGAWLAGILACIACGAFWVMMTRERTRLIGATIANEIREAITETTEVESIIEIKRMKSGILARVYLIGGKDKAILVNRAVARRIEQCTFKEYLWVMQLTHMSARGDLRETQRMLNEQLIEELLRNRRKDR